MGILDRFSRSHRVEKRLQDAHARIEHLESQLSEGSMSSYDPDANLSASGGGSLYFRRLSQSQRDLEPQLQEQMQATAFYLSESNPMARRILSIVRDFVLGDGAQLIAQDDDQGIKDACQAVIDRFWRDPYNRLDLWSFDLVFELGLWGELCLPVTINPVDGSVRLGYIDPADILDVIVDPLDQKTPLVVVVRDRILATTRRHYRVIHMDDNPVSASYGRMVGVEKSGELSMEIIVDPSVGVGGERIAFDGACFFFTINKVTNARRGRSDLLTLADWIDAIDQHLFGEIDRALLMKAFVWDVSFEGAGETELLDYQRKNPAPKPGSVRYHNQKVKWEAVTPDLKTQDSQILTDLLGSHVATGSGLPKVWLNGLMDANRATAAEMGEPAIKFLTARQRYVKYIIEHILTFVLDQAELKKRLPRRKAEQGIMPPPWRLAVQMPEIRQKDMASAATTFASAVQALASALADDAVSLEVYQEIVAAMVQQFGIEVDLETMRTAITKEQAARAARAALAPYNQGVPQQDDQDEDEEPSRQEQSVT